MRLTFTTLFIIIFVLPSMAQASLETTIYRGNTVIRPSVGNIIKLVNSDYYDFKRSMSSNNYIPSSDGKMFCAKTIHFTYCIQKQTGEVAFFFPQDDSGLISALRRQLKEANVRPSYGDDFELYKLLLSDSTKVEVLIHEDSSGSGTVLVNLK